VFFTGDHPSWILRTDRESVRIYASGYQIVHAFSPCRYWGGPNDFLIYSEEGPALCEWVPEYADELGAPLPMRNIPRGRAYSNVVYDAGTGLVVASSVVKARFTLFDEEGEKIWEPDGMDVDDPWTDCSTLELITPDSWITMDGYVFVSFLWLILV
jgi:cleavage and polyadenylation specificity factor subunit 1